MLQKQIHQISEQDRLLSDLDLNVSLKISSVFHRLLLLSENSDFFSLYHFSPLTTRFLLGLSSSQIFPLLILQLMTFFVSLRQKTASRRRELLSLSANIRISDR